MVKRRIVVMRTKTFKFPANEGGKIIAKAKTDSFKKVNSKVYTKQGLLDLACMRDGYTTFDNKSFSLGWMGVAYTPNSLPNLIITLFCGNLNIFDKEQARFISVEQMEEQARNV